MNTVLLGIFSAVIAAAGSAAWAGPPPPGGGRWVAPPGPPGGAYRPLYPGWRPVVPGFRPYPYWGAGYWGPRAGIYIGAPGYWGAWPYAWPAAYALPLAPQVIVQPQPVLATPLPAEPSWWYYCTQPAGYFPYVQDCSHAWMKVVPQLPGTEATPPRLAP